jgi:hypothetical protein
MANTPKIKPTVGAKPRGQFLPGSLGDTGVKSYGGFITEEFLTELQGQKGIKVYREMSSNDPIVGAVIFALSMLIRSADFHMQEADDSPEAEEAAQLVDGMLKDMSVPFSTVIDEACTQLVYGYAPCEIVWKRRVGPDQPTGETRSKFTDGLVGIRNISLRKQQSIVKWEIDEDDSSIKGVWQQPTYKPQVFIPIEKMLLFRTTEEGNNPEGRSILRTAYRPWYMKKRIENFEGVGIERDLAGLPVARIPMEFMTTTADAEQKAVYNAWKELVKNVRRDQQDGIIIPSDTDQNGKALFDFELLTTGGTRQFDTTKIVDRYNRAIATSVLADFIFLGQQSVGSFALSSDKTALFATAVGTMAARIADVFNRHLLPRIWKYNALDYDVMPQMVPGDLETPNLTELGGFIESLAGTGAQLFPDRELENHLRKVAGLPPAPEEGEDIRAESPPGVDHGEGDDA